MAKTKWTYDKYWIAVLGERTEEEVIDEFQLAPWMIDEWLADAENTAARAGRIVAPEWTDFYLRALRELKDAARVSRRKV